MSLANPLNLLLLPPLLWLLYRAVWPSYPTTPKTQPTKYDGESYNWAPGSHPEVITSKAYNTTELSQFDGRKSQRILLAISKIDGGKVLERTVFDVSAGSNFYGPGECAGAGVREERTKLESAEREGQADTPRRHVRKLCGPRRLARHGQAVLRRG